MLSSTSYLADFIQYLATELFGFPPIILLGSLSVYGS